MKFSVLPHTNYYSIFESKGDWMIRESYAVLHREWMWENAKWMKASEKVRDFGDIERRNER